MEGVSKKNKNYQCSPLLIFHSFISFFPLQLFLTAPLLLFLFSHPFPLSPVLPPVPPPPLRSISLCWLQCGEQIGAERGRNTEMQGERGRSERVVTGSACVGSDPPCSPERLSQEQGQVQTSHCVCVCQHYSPKCV